MNDNFFEEKKGLHSSNSLEISQLFKNGINQIRTEMDMDNHMQFVNRFKGDNENVGSSFKLDFSNSLNEECKSETKKQFPSNILDLDGKIDDAKIEKEEKNEKNEINISVKSMKPAINSQIGNSGKRILTENLISPIIKKTIKKLRNSTFYRRLDQLKEYHFNIIQDNVFFKEALRGPNSSLSKKIKVWSPYNPFIRIFKILMFFQLMILFVTIPFQISFREEIKNSTFLMHNYFSIFIIIVNAAIKLNTGYFSNGLLIKDRSKIILNYSKTCLILDFLSLFSLLLFEFLSPSYKFTRLIMLLAYCQGPYFLELYSEIMQYFKLEVILKGKQEIIEILFVFLFLAHILGCLWHYSGVMSQEYMLQKRENWLVNSQIEDEIWQVHYIYSFYWAVVVMATVGFGDVHPTNVIEITFCMIAILTGCALYAYNLNKIGIILQKIYKEENEFKEELRIINNFMERKKIDSSLQTRIQEYLKFIWSEKKMHHTKKELEIINSLSGSLREELLLESYGGILKAFPILHEKFTEKSLKEMVSYIREIRYVPGDYIFNVYIQKYK